MDEGRPVDIRKELIELEPEGVAVSTEGNGEQGGLGFEASRSTRRDCSRRSSAACET